MKIKVLLLIGIIILTCPGCVMAVVAASRAIKSKSKEPDPVINALDLNHDGVIDAVEIANASTSLKTLDRNNDGKLSGDELKTPRHE